MNTHQTVVVEPVNRSQSPSSKVPGIFWRQSANQYMVYIGYHLAAKGQRRGQRVRKAHYLGRDLREATLKAIHLAQRWDEVVADHKAMLNRNRSQRATASLPYWRTDEWYAERAASEAEYRQRISEEPPEGEDLETAAETWTVKELMNRYLADLKQRVGLRGAQGLKPDTYRVMGNSPRRAGRRSG